MEVKSGISRLAQMQAVFQQRQSAAREQRLQQESQEQGGLSRTLVITERRSAGSLTNIAAGAPLAGSISTGKVRQMFDERRKGATGFDKSYPLQPLKARPAPPPARNEYSYKPPQKSTSSTRRAPQATSNPVITRAATKVLRQPINPYVDRNNGYNAKHHGYYDEQSNEIERNRNSPFRAEFELSALLNANHIEETTLDDEAFPDTSLDFEEMDLNNRANINRNGSAGPVKTTARHPAPKQNSLNGAGPINQNKLLERSKTTVKPTSQTNVVKKTVNNNKSPVKENIAKSPQMQSPAKASPSTRSSSTPSRQSSAQASPARFVPSTTSGDLINCPVCGRNFATDRIDKHREICQKTKQKKRKVYDALKHRVQGTDAEQFVRVRTRKNQSGNMQMPKRQPLQTNWRKKHEDFINAIRAAKKVQDHIKAGGKLSDLPPPPPSENPDYVQCPHCSRKFNQAAAERHIPKCATMEHNKPKRNPGNKPGASSRSGSRK